MNIKAIIFDLGGVLVDVDAQKTFDYWAQLSGVDKTGWTIRSWEYYDFERGNIADYAYFEYIMTRFGIEMSYEDFASGWNDMLLDVKSGIDNLLKKFSNKRLVILSNTNILHERAFYKKYAKLMSYFEYYFFSHYSGYIKPEPEAYKIVLDYLDLPADKIVFVDDKEVNVKAAEELGMHGIMAENAIQIAMRLKAIEPAILG